MRSLIFNKPATALMLTVLFEFFSYFGIRSLLILYFVNVLKLQDTQAYTLFGNYISLVFLTPLVGGWIADKIIGFKYAIILGISLIFFGYMILYFFPIEGLYIGLATIVLGVGFFKTNAICLLSECYPNFSAKKDSLYVWYYIFANLGGMLGPLMCAWIIDACGWGNGFITAGLAMLCGFMIFVANLPSFNHIGRAKYMFDRKTFVYFSLSIGVFLFLLVEVLKNNWAGWLLAITACIALPVFVFFLKALPHKMRNHIFLIFILTLFGTVFWIFDQQGSSSISLFIDRDVVRNVGQFIVPTGWFQSINSAVIILIGPLLAILLEKFSDDKWHVNVILKVTFGLFLLTIGFAAIYCGIVLDGAMTKMIWPIMGLIFIGVAELFIDPVIISEINTKAPLHLRGFLVGFYFLFVGAYANYASVQIAKLSVFYSQSVHATIEGYHQEFFLIFLVAALMTMSLLSIKFFKRFIT